MSRNLLYGGYGRRNGYNYGGYDRGYALSAEEEFSYSYSTTDRVYNRGLGYRRRFRPQVQSVSIRENINIGVNLDRPYLRRRYGRRY
jgi:hypothetical protein